MKKCIVNNDKQEFQTFYDEIPFELKLINYIDISIEKTSEEDDN